MQSEGNRITIQLDEKTLAKLLNPLSQPAYCLKPLLRLPRSNPVEDLGARKRGLISSSRMVFQDRKVPPNKSGKGVQTG